MSALLSKMNGSVPLLARAVVRAMDDPDKQGRIKVEYPWYNGASGQMPSEWARLCLPYASKQAGMWMLPEVGDEVIVFFENGNIDSPIVMGSLFSSRNTPPESGKAGDHNSDGKNNLRFIKTKSGHLLCFDDSEDGGITVQDRDKRKFEINSKEKSLTLTDEQNNQIVIDPKGVIVKSKGGSQVEVKDDGITIKSKGGGEVSVKDSTISINAAAKIELGQGAAMSLVKGEAFQALFNSHIHGTAWGPSTPPMVPMTPAVLSMKVKTV